ncbi:MAG: DUF2141 domain-containing protein [Sedimentitalea sp.]
MTYLKSLIVASGLIGATCAQADTLSLVVQATSNAGTLRAAVFDSQQGFDAGEFVAATYGPAVSGAATLTVKDLKPGTYGIAVFHDQNNNTELDRNLLGAPKEPFGFSNDPKIGFSAPGFDAFKFEYDGTATQLRITLNGT